MLSTSIHGERTSFSPHAPAVASARCVSPKMLSMSTWIFLSFCEFFMPRSLPFCARLRLWTGFCSKALIFCTPRAH